MSDNGGSDDINACNESDEEERNTRVLDNCADVLEKYKK